MDVNGINNYNIVLENDVVNDERPINTTIKKNNIKVKIENIVKRVIDICGGLIGTIALIPLTILIYIARIVLHENDGPIFYEQLRIGKNGKIFKMYKYRSMVIGADDKLKEYLAENEEARKEYKKYKKLKHDPRITKVGKFIRKTSLDEFPQFINVLIGDMSLVGPRPYLPREKEDMGKYYDSIIKTRPGITGYWQITGRSDVTFEDRLKMDHDYIENKNLKLIYKVEKNLMIKADREKIIRALNNIINNAIKYSPENEKIIIKSFKSKASKTVVLEVENTGVTIENKYLNEVFDPFFRVEKSRNRKTGGSGLGLYIVSKILKSHNLYYKIESKRNSVLFTIYF